VLVHWSSEHFFAKPFLNIEKRLVGNYICNIIRNEFPHFLLNVNILIQINSSINVHIIRIVVKKRLFTRSKSFNDEESVACKVIELRNWNIFPIKLYRRIRTILMKELELHQFFNRHFQVFAKTLFPIKSY